MSARVILGQKHVLPGYSPTELVVRASCADQERAGKAMIEHAHRASRAGAILRNHIWPFWPSRAATFFVRSDGSSGARSSSERLKTSRLR